MAIRNFYSILLVWAGAVRLVVSVGNVARIEDSHTGPVFPVHL